MSILSRILILSLLLWCSLNAASPQEALVQTIKRYNEGLVIAGQSGKVDMLRLVATDKIVQKTYLWLMSWQDDNLYMDSKVLDQTFKSFKMKGKNSVVRTDETWYYSYYDAKNKKLAWPATKIVYRMEYTLFVHNGRWIISNIKALSEKQMPMEE